MLIPILISITFFLFSFHLQIFIQINNNKYIYFRTLIFHYVFECKHTVTKTQGKAPE